MKKVAVINAGVGAPSNTKMLIDSITGALESQVSKRGDAVDLNLDCVPTLGHLRL